MQQLYGAVGVNSLFMDVAQCVNPALVAPTECGLAYWVLRWISMRSLSYVGFLEASAH